MLYISASNDAIDAVTMTKGHAIPKIIELYGTIPQKVAVIGDGLNDAPMFKTKGIGLIGAPANSQLGVKAYVSENGGFLSQRDALDGFFDFYRLAKERNMDHVISDRDGVIITRDSRNRGEEFAEIASVMGISGNPFITVLTGSSYEQNIEFMKNYGLNVSLSDNPAVVRNPYVVLVENGAVGINVLTGDTELELFDADDFPVEYKEKVIKKVGNIMPSFGFDWTNDYRDQKGKVYVPRKQAGLTINIPHTKKDGTKYRGTVNASYFVTEILIAMHETAEELGISYERLGF